MNVFDVDDNNHITGLITKIRNLYREFLSLDVAERGAGTSFLDFIKYSIRSKASTDGLTLSMRAATFAAKALNLALSMAVGALIGMAINGVVSAIADYAQRIDTAATKTKEEADAANNATSSLKDLVDAYEELGDKSGWSTEDFDQAKDTQEELLALAKEQGTLDENKVNQLDLQNGKYEEQLGLLKDITEEQLKASESKLIQSKDAQGNKLVKTAKDNNRSHFFSSISANANLGIMNELKDAGIDVFNKSGNFGVKDLNDPDSIAKYYSELGKALDYIVQNTTEAQRAAGGAYHTVYQYLMDEQAALQDDADAYNDSTDAVNENVNARRKLQAIDFWSDGKSNGMDVSYSFDKVNSAIETLKNTIDNFDASKLNDLLWGTNEGLTDEQVQALAALRKALTDMDFSADTDGVNAFIQALVQVGIVAQSSANGVDAVVQASQKMEDVSSKIDEIQTAYKNATTAIEEYNKYGYLSADTLQTLLNEDFEYLSCLELVDGQLQVNTEKYQGMIAAQYQSAAMALVEKANAELAKIAQGEKKDAVEDATKATEDQATALTERVCPALGEFAKASMTAAAAQEFLANGDAAWSVDPERTSNANTVLDEYQNTWTTLMDAMKEQNANGQLTQDTQQKLMELKPEFRALLTTDENGNATVNVRELRNLYQAQLEKLAKEFKGKPIGIQAEAMIKDIREPTPEEYEELAKKTVKYQLALAKYTKRIRLLVRIVRKMVLATNLLAKRSMICLSGFGTGVKTRGLLATRAFVILVHTMLMSLVLNLLFVSLSLVVIPTEITNPVWVGVNAGVLSATGTTINVEGSAISCVSALSTDKDSYWTRTPATQQGMSIQWWQWEFVKENYKVRVYTSDGVEFCSAADKAYSRPCFTLPHDFILKTIKPVKATSLSLKKTEASIKVGSAESLTVTITPTYITNNAVNFRSSNPFVATVNKDGNVSALTLGEATITASLDGHEQSCIVTVVE